jgi:hypothetical protein
MAHARPVTVPSRSENDTENALTKSETLHVDGWRTGVADTLHVRGGSERIPLLVGTGTANSMFPERDPKHFRYNDRNPLPRQPLLARNPIPETQNSKRSYEYLNATWLSKSDESVPTLL